MPLWMVRAGRHGEQEQRALSNGFVTIGWNELPDLSKINTKDDLKKIYVKTYPGQKKMATANEVGQIWRFLKGINIDDLVALPLKTQSAIAVGKVTGSYEYRKDLGEIIRHIRKVNWIRPDIPRTDFDQDLLYSLGAFMTVCQISRNDAETRIKAMLEGKLKIIKTAEFREETDIEEYSKDLILKIIGQEFKGHELARIVEEVIKAQGYMTWRSEPGPDGGVDILAGSGPLGFDMPKICIQVKSSTSPVGVDALRNLQGVCQSFKAEQGLLVSWGGFNRKVLEEARLNFFTIRLWDSGALLSEILKHYDKFSDEIKAELPLKRIWSPVFEEGSVLI